MKVDPFADLEMLRREAEAVEARLDKPAKPAGSWKRCFVTVPWNWACRNFCV
jgi:hypothetical protein